MQSIMNKRDRICNWQAAVVLTLAISGSVACGKKVEEPPLSESDQLFQSQREALEKAKAVELAAAKHAEALKQQEAQQEK